jgi:hypothetical protein
MIPICRVGKRDGCCLGVNPPTTKPHARRGRYCPFGLFVCVDSIERVEEVIWEQIFLVSIFRKKFLIGGIENV